jgi:hypothetical protein
MHLHDFQQNVERRSAVLGFKYQMGASASEALLQSTGNRLQVSFPEPVRLLYRCCNGLTIDSPALEVLPLEKLQADASSRIVFSILDSRHAICFDTSHFNEAGEWDILNHATGYRVTLTLASFWSNKIWAWVEKRRPVWEEWVHA